jgi:hypothetical protein
MSLKDGSRYLMTQIVQVVDPATGQLLQPAFVDLRERVSSVASDDKFFVPDASMGWAQVGISYLKDARAWWVVADLSEVIDPFTELLVNQKYRVPTLSRYYMDIAPGQRQNG